MTLFINGRFRQQPMSGVQRYATEIVLAIDALAAEKRISVPCRLVVPPGTAPLALKAIEQVEFGRFGGHVWEQLDFARAARDGVALCLAGSGPVFKRSQVCVIHDAAIYRFPDNYSKNYRLLHKAIDRQVARRATIATVSEFSRGELSECLSIPADKIVVAPNAAEHLSACPDETVFSRIGLASDQPYFLTIGSLTRNKNVQLAVRAIAAMPADIKLVVVGRIDGAVFAAQMPETSEQTILAGRLSDEEVTALMRKARALVFPSFYEGFGIPPLEAFANACPVLASSIPPVREVCGDAADYFDPHDAQQLAALMHNALADRGDWRAERLRRGSERLRLFSWKKSAATLIEACEAQMGKRG